MPDNIPPIPNPDEADAKFQADEQRRENIARGYAFLKQNPEQATRFGLDPQSFLTPQKAGEQQKQIEGTDKGLEAPDAQRELVGQGVKLAGGDPNGGVATGINTALTAAELLAPLGAKMGIFGKAGEAAKVAEGVGAAEGAASGAEGAMAVAGETAAAPSTFDTAVNDLRSKISSVLSPEAVANQTRRVTPIAESVKEGAGYAADPDFVKRLYNLPPGTAFKPEQYAGLAQVATNEVADLQTSARAILTMEDGPEKEAKILELYHRGAAFSALDLNSEGVEAESARLMRLAQSGPVSDAIKRSNSVRGIFEAAAKGDNPYVQPMDLVRALASSVSPEEAATSLSDLTKDGAAAMTNGNSNTIMNALYNAALSNPAGVVKKLGSDIIQNHLRLAGYWLAERYGQMFQKDPTVPLGTTAYGARGLYGALTDAFRAAGKALDTGEPVISKALHSTGMFGLEGIDKHLATDEATPELSGALRYLHYLIPTRWYMAAGEAQKGVTYQMGMHLNAWSYAMKEAQSQGLQGADAFKYAEQTAQSLMKLPPGWLRTAASKEMELNSFIQEPTGMWKIVNDALNHNTRIPFTGVDVPLARILTTLFFRTPLNLMNRSLDYTPVGFARAAQETGMDRGVHNAQAALGSVLMGLVAYMHHEGHLTGGGPADPAQRELWLRTHKPYTLSMGGVDVNISKAEPIAAPLMTALDFADIYPHLQGNTLNKAAYATQLSLGRAVRNQSFLQGIISIFDIAHRVQQGEQSGLSALAEKITGTMTPAILRQVASLLDPIHREARTAVDRAKEEVPGYSTTLPPHRNAFGESMYVAPGYNADDAPGFAMRAANFLSPYKIGTPVDKVDPVYAEIERTGAKITRMKPVILGRNPSDSPGVTPNALKDGFPLSPEQYDRLQVLAGNNNGELPGHKDSKYERMEKLIQSPMYQRATPPRQAQLLESINHMYNDAARTALIRENSDLRQSVRQFRVNRLRAARPQQISVNQ